MTAVDNLMVLTGQNLEAKAPPHTVHFLSLATAPGPGPGR